MTNNSETDLENVIVHDHHSDGIDRRGFLKCMAWAGTGMLWSLSGGLLSSRVFGQNVSPSTGDWSFVQISDSHIGFKKAANSNVLGTFQEAVAKINALPTPPAFILHTGDLTQLARADQFDTVAQILKGAKTQTGQVFYVPGEHDVVGDGGKLYRERHGAGTKGDGWYSFDQHGVHFIGLVNVLNLKAQGMGDLGQDQLQWLKRDVAGLSSSTPLVVFAHIPLWAVYPQWGWGTDDSTEALSYLKRFGSVTVLNGHIHQVQQKVEGHVSFHTAMSTAFPQPAPGTAPTPGPMVVPAGQLGHVLGITSVSYVPGGHPLAVVDMPLVSAASALHANDGNNDCYFACPVMGKGRPMFMEIFRGTTAVMIGLLTAVSMAQGAPSHHHGVGPAVSRPIITARRDQILTAGHSLFVTNCSPCHGANAEGDDGPNLHE